MIDPRDNPTLGAEQKQSPTENLDQRLRHLNEEIRRHVGVLQGLHRQRRHVAKTIADAKGGVAVDDHHVGLYNKYLVLRADGADNPGEKHEDCEYLVLDLTHDRNAPGAAMTYAATVHADGYGPLADDIEAKFFGGQLNAEQLVRVAQVAANLINNCTQHLVARWGCEVIIDAPITRRFSVGDCPVMLFKAVRPVNPSSARGPSGL